MVWIVFARAPASDVAYWTGRRSLGVVDAIAWPLVIVWLAARSPLNTSTLMPLLSVVCAINALTRARTALVSNHRYRFTTWRAGQVVVVLLLVGLAMKFATGTR